MGKEHLSIININPENYVFCFKPACNDAQLSLRPEMLIVITPEALTMPDFSQRLYVLASSWLPTASARFPMF